MEVGHQKNVLQALVIPQSGMHNARGQGPTRNPSLVFPKNNGITPSPRKVGAKRKILFLVIWLSKRMGAIVLQVGLLNAHY